MVRAKNGDRVAVHYIGTLDNGRIFDSTQEVGPLRFTLGAGDGNHVLAGLDLTFALQLESID
jgi:FKBP-type peptidyl-prolyl cis-trans isomerase 2